jgi:GcrA cell cycle regulator
MIIDTFNTGPGPWLIPGITERLIELHGHTGPGALSASGIATALNTEFGTHLTRSSIISRAHRIGLAPRPAPIVRRTATPKIRVDTPIEPEEAIKPANGDGFTLFQLRDSDCHWPLGDIEQRPPFFYCGQVALEGRPYCAAHCRKAYNSPQMRWE